MSPIGSKTLVKPIVESSLTIYHKKGITPFVKAVHNQLLDKKIRFPVLEFAAELVCAELPVKDQLLTCKQIVEYRTIGGNVMAGIILQKYALTNPADSFKMAVECILYGNEWYCCDIIAERVMGVSLLLQPEKTIPLLKKLTVHKADFAVRTVGVATHYAVKKGLKKIHVEEMYKLLLSLATATGFHTKTGIGWGAKTCAKFHPDIIKKYRDELNDEKKVKTWFRTKVNIGLGRTAKYAAKYNR
ncbi:MAG TPA: DNA alkylation repair protein [Flavobacteriales bacterium]|nr:DNA alkylation repair protein [Flavobacteriales bacterium]